MEHWEYRRIVKGASRAVLFVHGILGTPRHFAPLLSMIPQTVSVYNLLLDGHGRDPWAFSRASMKKWEAQVDGAVRELLACHEKVYIVAHSMGGLFAIEQAVKTPEVAGLFLLAVPLKLRLRAAMVKNSLKMYFNKIDPTDPRSAAAQNCCGVALTGNPLAYLGWIPRFLELFSKIRRTRKLLPWLKTPGVVCLSGRDELVSLGSFRYFKGNPAIRQRELKDSGHYYYPREDMEVLLWEFQNFIARAGR